MAASSSHPSRGSPLTPTRRRSVLPRFGGAALNATNTGEIAAHRVADALRVIAANLPKLTAQASDPVYDLLVTTDKEAVGVPALLTLVSELVEATAPFAPLTDDEKQALFEQVYEEMTDSTAKDHARDYMDMAEWQLRVEKDERDEYMKEDLD